MHRLSSLLRQFARKLVIEVLTDLLEEQARPQTRRIKSIALTPGTPMAIKATISVNVNIDGVLEADGVVSTELSWTVDGIPTGTASFPPAGPYDVTTAKGVTVALTLTDIDQAGNRSAGDTFTYFADASTPDVTSPATRKIGGVTLEEVPDGPFGV